MEVLNRHWQELITKQNVLSVGLGTKFTAGKDTGVQAIVIFVSQKLAPHLLTAAHLIPTSLERVPTDVIELNPEGWTAGKTALSLMHPEDVKRRLGLREKPSPKAIRLTRPAETPSGAANWTAWASPIQDQMNCGCCVAHGNIGVWEACIRVLEKKPDDPIKLSESFPFFCTPGAGCDTGSDPQAFLDQCVSGGTVPESCLPFEGSPASQGKNQGCHVGACPDYSNEIIKLESWASITDQTEIKSLLDAGPLNCTMAVHQSFFNYTGGVYKNLGPSDPIVGYHDIGCFGYSDVKNYKIIRNSWSVAWGQNCVIDGVTRPGYCLINPGELDPEMQELIVGGDPVAKTGSGTVDKQDAAGEVVTITILKPDGTNDTPLTAQTDGAGNFSVPYTPPMVGQYSTEASIGEDADYQAAVSPVATFVVAKAGRTITLGWTDAMAKLRKS